MRRRSAPVVLAISLVTLLTIPAVAVAGTTERVSVASDGAGIPKGSEVGETSIDGRGRVVVFTSDATDLVAGDTNGEPDVFVRDRTTGTTTRVSVASDGTEADGGSDFDPTVSGSGRYVAFTSTATNLVASDVNGVEDVFIHDRDDGTTSRVSVASDGTAGNGASLGTAVMSWSGRFVAFASAATNLVASDTNAVTDVFVHDRKTGITTRVSVASDGTAANGVSVSPSISAGGRYVAFTSRATNLDGSEPSGAWAIFIHDRTTGKTSRVSVASDGTAADDDSVSPSVSADGRLVAFTSFASGLVAGDTNGVADIFVHDRSTGRTRRVSVGPRGREGDGESLYPMLSTDGRTIVFESDATTLVRRDTNGMTDIFVRDLADRRTYRVSLSFDGLQADGRSGDASIDAHGKVIAFRSEASNLVRRDRNTAADIFVRVR